MAKEQPAPITASEVVALLSSKHSCDPFDGKEHNYMELGGWIGDQGLAMMFMGLGTLLGVFKLLSPYTVLGAETPHEMALQAASAGFLSIVKKEIPCPTN